ncbi:TolB family protein [Streptomyces sp. NPDC056817]|uniref:TolB family protein n=1 Tax=Streptomyces sp. NPDC056817 TaxID=3345950 RepID=UPI0036B688F4
MAARVFRGRPGASVSAGAAISLASALALALASTAVPATAASHPPRVERVSTATDGTEADGASTSAVISDDGRHAAFLTRAENLGCSAGYPCMQVRDLVTGAVTTVREGGGFWWAAPSISGDGRYVGYSAGSKLPAPYLHDRRTGQSQRIWPDVPPSGAELGQVWSLSRHGTHIAYMLGNRNGPAFTRYLYVRDTATGTDELISGADEPPKAAASLSADGTAVAYMTGFTSDDPADTADVFVVDRATGRKVQVDTGLGQARLIQLSDDGRYVVFDAQGGTYVRDLRTGHLHRVADTPAKSASRDARYLLLSGADGLRLLDRRTGRSAAVGPAGSEAVPGAVSAKGRAVVFGSAADDLVPGDTNGASDIFVYRAR